MNKVLHITHKESQCKAKKKTSKKCTKSTSFMAIEKRVIRLIINSSFFNFYYFENIKIRNFISINFFVIDNKKANKNRIR